MAKRSSQSVTVNDVASHVNLSKSTVSYVLSGKAKHVGIADATVDRVRSAASELGYVSNYWASALRKQKTGIVSVMLDTLQLGWAERVVNSIEPLLQSAGYTPIILTHRGVGVENTSKETANKTQAILQRRDEALICQPRVNAKEEYRILAQSGVPIIFIGSILDDMSEFEDCSYVIWDCGPAANKVMEHLITSGCKSIAYFAIEVGVASDNVRYEAYVQSLASAGLEIKDEWVFRHPVEAKLDYDLSYADKISDYIRATVRKIIDLPDRPEAIFALNDAQAIAIVQTFKSNGFRVPEDIKVISMGDLSVSHFLGLTTAYEPLEEIGELAAQIAIDILSGKEQGPVKKKVTSNLIMKRTTA